MKASSKLLLTLVMAVILLLILIPATVFADAYVVADGRCGNNLTWKFTSDGVLRISGTGDMYDFPAEADEPIYESSAPWRGYASDYIIEMTTVIVDEGVTSIGDYAFSDLCFYLEKVKLPSTVKEIGDYAFEYCPIKQITLPKKLEYIGDFAFYRCNELKEVEFGDLIIEIGHGAFEYCSELSDIEFPQSLNYIHPYAFAGCSSLKNLTLPKKVSYIDHGAFMDCTGLESVTITSGDTPISKWAFGFCSSLKSVTFTASVPNWIHYDAFSYVTATVYYPKNDPSWTKDMFQDYGGDLIWKAYAPKAEELAKPKTSIGVIASSGKPQVKWAAIAGAAKYEVYRATSKTGKYTKISATTKTSYTDTKAISGKTYYYKVRAIGKTTSQGNSPYSAPIYITCDCARPATKISNVVSSGKPQVKWSAIAGASKYEVYRGTSKTGKYTKISTTAKTSYTDTKAIAGKTYYYKVKAINKLKSQGNSAYSAPIYVTCDCARPAIKVTNVASSGKPLVKWAAVSGASKYEVYRGTTKTGKYTKISTTAKTSYTDTKAISGKTYYYKVKAISKLKSQGNSAYSAPIYVTCDCARPIIKVTNVASSGKPQVKWAAVSGASKYEVYRGTTKTGKYTKISTTTKTSYTDTKAIAGKTYYYKVKAVSKLKSQGNSAYSTVKSIVCKKVSNTVYIGKTGTKYHKASCSTLKGKGTAISLSKAKSQGRSACKVCKP